MDKPTDPVNSKTHLTGLVQHCYYTPFFETVIRYLGGLLSAYALSGEPILLARADDLGTLLLPVFKTPSGLPAFSVSVHTGQTATGWMGESILFSEATSCQLEFKYLAKLTGRKEYYTAVERIMEHMYAQNPKDGLFALTWTRDGKPRDGESPCDTSVCLLTQPPEHYSVGASADSGYEYMLKQYLLTGDTKALAQYLKSTEGILNTLLHLTPTRDLLYVGSSNHGKAIHAQEHLACFLPGVLALGAASVPASHPLMPEGTRERHRWAAAGLAYTCYVAYADQESGLGPDGMRMVPGRRWGDALGAWERGGRVGAAPGTGEAGRRGRAEGEGQRDYTSGGNPVYLLRPRGEWSFGFGCGGDATVESLYVMWKTTGEEKWRERGWEIFSAIERHVRTPYGYASVERVDSDPVHLIDDMP
ncbi:hypothetical protein H0H81_010599, partial [Sphagnurus paluster]